MPVAASQKDPQIVQYHQLLPKPPSCHAGHITSNFVPSPENLCGAESVALMPEGASQLASLSAAVSGVGESQGHYISTHSPPILNLSPNLSPTEPQRTSPFYDLRESTRRRSIQDLHSNLSQQMQHSPQIYSGIITDDPTRKSESPSRKRRKTSGNIVDLTNSPSPPPSSQRDAILDAARSVRRRSSTQRRVPGERCTTPRARRREDLRGSNLLDLRHSCGCVETCYIDGWSNAHNLKPALYKGLYQVPEQYAAHAESRVRRPIQCVGGVTALTGPNISSTDSHDLLTLEHTVSWPQIDYCPSHCVILGNRFYPLFEINGRSASSPIVPTRPAMASLAESDRPVRDEGGILPYRQRDLLFDRHLREFGLISVDGSVNEMVFEHLYQLCSQHNLIQFYQELHSQYIFEFYLWLYVRICVDRKMQKVQQKLEIISRILGQPVESVLISTLTSFVQKLVSKQKQIVDSTLILLRQVDIGEVTPLLASRLEDLARTTNIQLDSKRLQRKFCRDVAITARRILMEYQNGLVSKFSSPGTRRRTTRERNTLRQSESPERRAFQPPVLTGRQLHPAAVLPGQSPQHPVVIDVDQVQVSAPVSMTPYAIPVCTGPHHMPVCSAAHMQMCNTQPTWSIPACTVQLPSCSMQHIPACSLQQMPVPHTIPPILHHTHHPPPHHPMPHHHGLTHAGHAQFPHVPQPQMRDEEVQIIAEHRPHYPLPPSIHPGATLNPSPPVILQEPVVHPTPHDIYMGPYQRYYARRAAGRSRLRGSLPPPPPPYPGFLLHFLAMLGNPPVPPYGRDPPDEATEENYEALLSLAERLGEAKPRGLSKADIKQLPAYYFNSETPRSDLDQTSCVVCMCDFESRQLLRVLPCGHEFHTKCVDKWLKTNRTCPICRADATDMAGNHSE